MRHSSCISSLWITSTYCLCSLKQTSWRHLFRITAENLQLLLLHGAFDITTGHTMLQVPRQALPL